MKIIMEKTIEKIQRWEGKVPRNTIKFLSARKREAVPYLIKILKTVTKNPKYYMKDKNYIGHKIALYMLAQFRCKEAFEVVLALYSIDEGVLYELLGFNAFYDESRILASVYNGNLDALKEVIEDQRAGEVHRNACVDTLKILALQAVVERKNIIDYYRHLMKRATRKQESEVECAAFNSIELYPVELMDEIERLYKEKKLDDRVVFRCSFKHALEQDKNSLMESYAKQQHNSFIDNILDETILWEEISEEV